MGLLAIAVGAYGTVRAPSEMVGNLWLYGVLGVVAVASGVVTLRTFLARTTTREG